MPEAPRQQRPPSPERLIFGRRVREERQKGGWTLEALAAEAQMNWSYIAQIERGERNLPIDTMSLIAQALGVSVISLLTEE
ncbi:helix-turn-helix domain-containing protein [Deinococcus antarcticus]|uniref:Helix-turn-helix domain-containing protein n=1 Tax=Deinococcus antarcticus TaxID=1298767 RepID=A0ABV8A6T6_9DEIO